MQLYLRRLPFVLFVQLHILFSIWDKVDLTSDVVISQCKQIKAKASNVKAEAKDKAWMSNSCHSVSL